MLTAKPAILLDLKPFGIVLLVLVRIVIALLAFQTGQSYLIPASFSFRHFILSFLSQDKKHCRKDSAEV